MAKLRTSAILKQKIGIDGIHREKGNVNTMSLFRINYDRPGPGVEKGAPPKKGIARWWEVITRDFGALLQANIYFVVCALPVLTCTVLFYVSSASGAPWMLMLLLNVVFAIPMGPALAALHRLTMQMARDEPFFTWHEFKKAYKQDFKQGAIAMAIMMILADVIMLNLYLLTVMKGYTVFTVAMLILSIYIWFSLLNTLFQQIAMMELPLFTIFKNSLLLVVVAGWRGLVIVLLDIIIFVAVLMFSYIAAPLALFGLFGILTMTTDLIFWPRFKQIFIDHDIERKPRRSARDEWSEIAEKAEQKAVAAEKKSGRATRPSADEQWAKQFLEEREEAARPAEPAVAPSEEQPSAPEEHGSDENGES